MPTITLRLSDAQHRYILDQMTEGDYDDPSEYFRDLIRADQKRSARQALEENLLSALAEETDEDPWKHHHHQHPEKL